MARSKSEGSGGAKRSGTSRRRRRLFDEIPEDPEGLLELSERMMEGWEKHKDDPGLQGTESGRELAALMDEVRSNATSLRQASENARQASARVAAACSSLWAQRRGLRNLAARHAPARPRH